MDLKPSQDGNGCQAAEGNGYSKAGWFYGPPFYLRLKG